MSKDIWVAHSEILSHGLDLLVVVGAGESGQTVRIQTTAARVKLGAIVLPELGAERVYRYNDGSSVRLELQIETKLQQLNLNYCPETFRQRENSYSKNLAHSVGGRSADVLAEFVESLEIGFVKGVPNYLNVHLVQILL